MTPVPVPAADPGDVAPDRLVPGAGYEGLLDGYPFCFDPGPERDDDAALVGLGRGPSIASLDGTLVVPVPVRLLVRALASAGREAPSRAARIVGEWHDRPRGGRSRLSAILTKPASACPPLAGLWADARRGESPEAFVMRHAPPGRIPDPVAVRRILAGPWAIPDHDTLRALLSIPVDWFPADEGSRDELAALVGATAPLAGCLGSYDFLNASKGRWAEYRETLSRRLRLPASTGGGPWMTEAEAARLTFSGILRDRVLACIDMTDAFGEQVVLPALMRKGVGGQTESLPMRGTAALCAASILASGRGLASLLDLSAEWHARTNVIDLTLLRFGGRQGSWPAPFARAAIGDGILAVPLTDVSGLLAEGSSAPTGGLDHCVASYAARCRDLHSVIVSIRRQREGGSPRRLSTVELSFKAGRFRVVQHRGLRNAAPPPEAAEALERLMADLRADRIAVFSAFRLAHARSLASGDAREPAFDWRRPDAVAALRDAWAPLLPRPLREDSGIEACVERTAEAVACTWEDREAGYFAEARFGLSATGYRPWSGPERGVPLPARLGALVLAPLVLWLLLPQVMRSMAWRMGRPSLDRVLGGVANHALTMLPPVAVAFAILVDGIMRFARFLLAPPGVTTSDVLLAMMRSYAAAYVVLSVVSYAVLMGGSFRRGLRRRLRLRRRRPGSAAVPA